MKKLARWMPGLVFATAACGGESQPAEGTADPSASAPAASAPSAGASTAAAAPEAAAKRPTNVLLITIDSLRADMPWVGYDKAIAPHLTALAEESVVYTRAYSVSSYTSKTVGGLLSGRHPSTLYRGCTFFTEYSEANVFFPELLQAAGVRTLSAHAHLYFDRGKNLRQGFDDWRVVDGLKWNAETDESVTSQKLTPLAIEMLSAVPAEKPFFAWFHYMDPHDKYVRHDEVPSFGRKARNLYDNEVFYTDRWVHELLEWSRRQPWFDHTAVIVSSDHGEAFGEHDMWKHAFALWEVLTHVPLIIKVPGGKAQRIDARRSQLDLAPTILDLLEVPIPDGQFVGKSMVPELRGAEPDNREPILLDLPPDTYNPPTRAAIAGDFKLIDDPGPKYKLYHLTKDPGETRNLARDPRHRDDLARMKQVFAEAWRPHPRRTPYGGKKLIGGGRANGPKGPDDDAATPPPPP
ncbi:MAG: sulfatase [Myxococcota bacterium]